MYNSIQDMHGTEILYREATASKKTYSGILPPILALAFCVQVSTAVAAIPEAHRSSADTLVTIPLYGIEHSTEAANPAQRKITYRPFAMGGYGDGSSWAGGGGLGLSFAPIQRWKRPSILTPGIEITHTYWSGRSGSYETSKMRDTGITLLLRLDAQPNHRGLFAEAGFGLHQHTETRFYSKNLGRHTQAGSNAAIGYYIPRTPLEISVRVRHLSNARTKPDNSGINQIQLRIATRF